MPKYAGACRFILSSERFGSWKPSTLNGFRRADVCAITAFGEQRKAESIIFSPQALRYSDTSHLVMEADEQDLLSTLMLVKTLALKSLLECLIIARPNLEL